MGKVYPQNQGYMYSYKYISSKAIMETKCDAVADGNFIITERRFNICNLTRYFHMFYCPLLSRKNLFLSDSNDVGFLELFMMISPFSQDLIVAIENSRGFPSASVQIRQLMIREINIRFLIFSTCKTNMSSLNL